MAKNADAIALLVYKYMTDELTEQEAAQLNNWKAASPTNQALFDELTNSDKLREYSAVRKKFFDRNPNGKLVTLNSRWVRGIAAACVLLIISTSAYLWFSNSKQAPIAVATKEDTISNDVAPGVFKAKLTLSNGSTLVLDSLKSGVLATQGNAEISYQQGKLVYNKNEKPTTEVLYNTLTTANGETYSLWLSDGSRVWLNAGSSITYPVNFTGNQRSVSIQGEVFFEVATVPLKNGKGKTPFLVTARGTQVEVLGTQFNINAYDDETQVKTTLIEGKVKVSLLDKAATGNQVLVPGQQAKTNTHSIQVLNTVNLQETMAWKNGMFLYEKANLEDIMKQVSRWYNVEVVFKEKINKEFRASIPRDVPVSRLLRIFEMTGDVHFKVEGKRISVLP